MTEISRKVVIYHNPRCSKSRQTLDLIRSEGIEPNIILYLEHPLQKADIKQLLINANLSVKAAFRENESVFQALEIKLDHLSDDEIIALMVEHPILLNRPFVASDKGVRLCRPPELVLDIL